MRAVIVRVMGSKREYMRYGCNNYWTEDIERARVFTQVGHAKNSIRKLVEAGETECKYYVQRVKVVPSEAGPLEEYVHGKEIHTW